MGQEYWVRRGTETHLPESGRVDRIKEKDMPKILYTALMNSKAPTTSSLTNVFQRRGSISFVSFISFIHRFHRFHQYIGAVNGTTVVAKNMDNDNTEHGEVLTSLGPAGKKYEHRPVETDGLASTHPRHLKEHQSNNRVIE